MQICPAHKWDKSETLKKWINCLSIFELFLSERVCHHFSQPTLLKFSVRKVASTFWDNLSNWRIYFNKRTRGRQSCGERLGQHGRRACCSHVLPLISCRSCWNRRLHRILIYWCQHIDTNLVHIISSNYTLTLKDECVSSHLILITTLIIRRCYTNFQKDVQ